MDEVGEIKSRLNIEDVISEYVKLKRAGRNYKGLSPFTNEKTPSFVVSPEKQIWHDFSSGKGGDMFTFVQDIEGLDFKGALELLARKAGVDIEQYKTAKKSGLDKNRLSEALESAAKFYQSQLAAKPEAAKYILQTRGFSKDTALEFQLGYSPDNKSSLTDFLIKKGFSQKELLTAGLSTNRGGVSDMFRGRIMVPLHDSFGKVIGFTARLLEDKPSAPKYINTPATPLYDKSRHVFGLHLAKKQIREKNYSIIVEGNLDVIASHQAGIKNVVAAAGTALTEFQLKALSRFSPDVRIAFDQDRAGLEAAERAIPIASKTGVNLSIISIPEGKDPDELIKKDPKLWEQAITDADYAVDWLIDQYKKKLDISTAKGKREFSDVILKVIKKIDDPVEQDHYLNLISDLAKIDLSALKRKMQQSNDGSELKKPKAISKNLEKILDKNQINTIDKLFSLALMLPGARTYTSMLKEEMLVTEEQIELFKFISDHPDFDGTDKTQTDKLMAPKSGNNEVEGEHKLVNYVKILSLQFEELYAQVDSLELQYEAERLRARIIEYFVKNQKNRLSEMLRSANEEERNEILKKVHILDQLLTKVKRA